MCVFAGDLRVRGSCFSCCRCCTVVAVQCCRPSVCLQVTLEFVVLGVLVVACCCSALLFMCWQVSLEFVVGTTLVILAVYLYSSFPPSQPGLEIEIEAPKKPEHH